MPEIQIVIEEFMTGREAVRIFVICDGTHIKPMTSAQDHKRAKDNDEGLKYRWYGNLLPKSVL